MRNAKTVVVVLALCAAGAGGGVAVAVAKPRPAGPPAGGRLKYRVARLRRGQCYLGLTRGAGWHNDREQATR